MQQLKKEIWKDIPGYEGLYQVSNHGRIKSLKKFVKHPTGSVKILKSKILRLSKIHGYEKVELWKNGKNKIFRVHRLVALVFIKNPNNLKEVNHKDGNKTNNHVSNLEWVNARENQTHSLNKKETSSKYIGVTYKKGNKIKVWCSRLWLQKKSIHLGYFETEEEAHQAYLSALKEHGLKNKYAITI